MLYVLNYFIYIQQILSDLVVSVVYWTIWVLGSNPTGSPRMDHFQLEISSKCDIKAENSSTLCKYGISCCPSRNFQKRLGQKKIKPNKELWPEGFGVMLQF